MRISDWSSDVCSSDLAAESALLRVNPADVALLDGKLPKNVFAAGDEGVQRGAFVLEAASTIVEDGPDLWLEQLGQAIDRIAVPTIGRASWRDRVCQYV